MRYFHYIPKDGVLADVVPFYWDGAFRLFYLHDYRDMENHGEGCLWRQIVSKDMVHFEEKGDMILRGAKEDQDLFIFTGCVLRAEERFHIFYTGHNYHYIPQGKPQEAVMHAVSDDLEHWEKCEGEYFFAPEGYEIHDWRDPFVFFDDTDGLYHMILAARKKDGPAKKCGCTVHAVSADLKSWRVEKPLWDPELYYTHECPDLFRMGDWYYLIFSEFSDDFRTRYVRSRSLYGPWEAPADDVFDGRAYYAAKTAFDGEKRYLFGWNPTRESNKDDGPFQWGGHLIVHEVYQDTEGNLRVRMPEAYPAHFDTLLPVEMTDTPHVQAQENGWLLDNTSGYAELVTAEELPQVCMITAEVEMMPGTRQFGLRFRYDPAEDISYAMCFRPDKEQWRCITMPRTAWGKMDEYSLQRYMPEGSGATQRIALLLDHDVVTLYVNDAIAMTTRICNGDVNHLAFYVAHGCVKIRHFQVCVCPESCD